jgi:polyribonucleotide nucleotidyltransferase
MTWSKQCTLGDRQFTIETGKLAMQANSAVTVRYGDTVVLVTTCIGSTDYENNDFVRLTIDYEERHYAVGKIPGSFIRREGRPSEQATLSARLTDRSLRPLLYKEFPKDLQVIITILSTDQENSPDILALVGASATLMLSGTPFNGPVGATRVGYINGAYIVNPTLVQLNDSLIDVVVASTKDAVVMVEAEGKEAPEDIIAEAIKIGFNANQQLIKIQEDLYKECGKPRIEFAHTEINPELLNVISSEYGARLTEAITQPDRDKREESVSLLKNELLDKLQETYPEPDILAVMEKQLKKLARKSMLEKRQHLDGRKPNEIRPLSCEVGLLPRTHGSAIFQRGRTQVLTITTLGSLRQEQMIDGLGLEDTKRFMHHYNMPPFSNGEVKRLGTPGRREIGHGALAERALEPVIPKNDDFTYTIRLVSEVLSSNGSTSMASTCASSLSLMDAGVPIKAPVAGIAMGLVTDDSGNYMVLTDIEGMEDAYGDMDCKVAGTRDGITAIQLDIKLQGLNMEILTAALAQAKEARYFILDTMAKAITASRTELSPYAPRNYKLTIDQGKIGAVIGPGGKTIRGIIEETKVTIDVENDGTVIIGSPNEESAQKAINMIEALTREVEVGAIYTGKVTRVMNFGAFVEILPGKEGLVHISELADYRVGKVEDVAKVGDEITVKVTEIDNMGRINLSRRVLLVDSSAEPANRENDSSQGDNRPYRPQRSGFPPRHGGDRDNRPHHQKR